MSSMNTDLERGVSAGRTQTTSYSTPIAAIAAPKQNVFRQPNAAVAPINTSTERYQSPPGSPINTQRYTDYKPYGSPTGVLSEKPARTIEYGHLPVGNHAATTPASTLAGNGNSAGSQEKIRSSQEPVLDRRTVEPEGATAEDTEPILSKKHVRILRAKNHFLAFVGELVGTVLFMYFALGATNVANLPATTVTGTTTDSSTTGDAVTVLNTSSLMYISLAFGFSLAICAWIFFRVSGGLFNPAVSFGLMVVGVISPFRAALLTIAQCAGAIAGAGFVQLTLPGNLNATTRLGSGTSIVQGLFIEMFCTSLLMFAVLFLAAEKSKATFLAPIGIGLALFIGELVGVLYTGGSLNPARSLGPDVILAKFAHYHWIYWVGPGLGALLAAVFYKLIKLMHFETVVPGQDDDGSQAALLAMKGNSAGLAHNSKTKPGATSLGV